MTGTDVEHGVARPEEATGIVALFAAAFAASGGPQEGRLIGGLATDMMAMTPPEDIAIFVSRSGGAVVGCIMFSRLRTGTDPRWVLILSPVAVATAWQGRGVGTALIRFGIDAMRARGADVAVTYGNSRLYGRFGFATVDAAMVQPPRPLTHPEGWLAQSLGRTALEPLPGPVECVAALDRADYW